MPHTCSFETKKWPSKCATTGLHSSDTSMERELQRLPFTSTWFFVAFGISSIVSDAGSERLFTNQIQIF